MDYDAAGLKVEKLNGTNFYARQHRIQLVPAWKELDNDIEEEPPELPTRDFIAWHFNSVFWPV